MGRKISTTGCLTMVQREKLELLIKYKYIKSLSQGIRDAVEDYLRINAHRLNRKGQSTISDWHREYIKDEH